MFKSGDEIHEHTHHFLEIGCHEVEGDKAVLATGVEHNALFRLLPDESDSVERLFELVHLLGFCSYVLMKKKGVRGLTSTHPRPESSSAGLTTSKTETDTHVIVSGTAGDRTATTGDTASLVVGESLLASSVELPTASGEGSSATVAIGRHNCSFLFSG